MSFVPKIKFGSSYGTAKTLPHVQSIEDNEPGIKNILIEGIRGSGALVIPGSRPSYDIVIKGLLLASDTTLPDGTSYTNPSGTNYEKLTEQINWLRTNIVTTESHLYVEKSSTVTYDDYVVIRLEEIVFPDNLRKSTQEYIITVRRT